MQVELIGCTSAGKSTMASSLLRAGAEQGIDIRMSEDFVLEQVRLGCLHGRLVRTLLVDLISLFVCLATLPDHRRFYWFALRQVFSLPATVAWLERLNIIRNTFKKVAVSVVARRRASSRQVVLADEGILHTANYLFVHLSVAPTERDLSTFLSLVPLPDVAVYVTQPELTLIERTLVRGHKRIPGHSSPGTRVFVRRSVWVFDWLTRTPALQDRLLVADGGHNAYGGEADVALLERVMSHLRTYSLGGGSAGYLKRNALASESSPTQTVDDSGPAALEGDRTTLTARLSLRTDEAEL